MPNMKFKSRTDSNIQNCYVMKEVYGKAGCCRKRTVHVFSFVIASFPSQCKNSVAYGFMTPLHSCMDGLWTLLFFYLYVFRAEDSFFSKLRAEGDSYTSSSFDPHLMLICCYFVAHLILNQSLLDPHLIPIWFLFDPHLILIWSSFDTNLILIWLSFDPHLIFIWTLFDPHMMLI